MPWETATEMSQRAEFVQLATAEGAAMASLCRRFKISRKTGYKWLERYAEAGMDGLSDRSRRPRRSPTQTPAAVEEAVAQLRAEHPAWGGRKLRGRLLATRRSLGLAEEAIPAASTIDHAARARLLMLIPLCSRNCASSMASKAFKHCAGARPSGISSRKIGLSPKYCANSSGSR